MTTRSLRTLALTAAALLLVTGAATGCAARGAAAGLQAPASASTPRPSPTAVGTGTGAAGSLTVDLSQPVAISGHVNTTVTCTTASRRYTVEVAATSIQGVDVAATVRVAAYTGPGQYSSSALTVTVDQPDGTVTTLALPAVPVTVTAAGGSISFTGTGANGRSVAGSLEWACSA